MNTAITPRFTFPTHTPAAERQSPMRRFFGVVGRAQSYRSIGYLLLGLVLATAWLTLLVTALSVSLSLVVVALLGIPLLLGTWYAVRAFANIERGLANVLLGQHLRPAPMASRHRGNVWVRLVAMSRDRSRWRELAYLVVRIPVGIATFVIATVASLCHLPSSGHQSRLAGSMTSATGPGAPSCTTYRTRRGPGV
jgi:Putative sensor